ncbi:hypothetical protein BKA61DRAFT_621927, partial [Leptodontidium sp. MPI-SDFR-AT-0119]
MSVSVLGAAELDSLVSLSSISALASSHNLTLPQHELADWSALLSGLSACTKQILSLPDYHPVVDTALYPRTSIHRPSGPIDTNEGGWAWKCTVRCTKPSSELLKEKTLAIKV